jgi:hypothetical protein
LGIKEQETHIILHDHDDDYDDDDDCGDDDDGGDDDDDDHDDDDEKHPNSHCRWKIMDHTSAVRNWIKP